MNTTHTPEPWHTFAFEVYDENQQIIADCGLSEDYWGKDGCQANAARIVACVNACAGIHDPQELIIGADFALKENRELKAQRDTLLEAIKSHLDLYNAGLLTDPQRLEEHTLKLAEIYTTINA